MFDFDVSVRDGRWDGEKTCGLEVEMFECSDVRVFDDEVFEL